MEMFKDRLRKAREARGLSQDQLAKLVGKEKQQSLIGNLESGGRASSTYIPEIAHALGVDAYWLKTGIKTLVAGDRKIDDVVEAMKLMSAEGKAIVLHEAKKALADYPILKQTRA